MKPAREPPLWSHRAPLLLVMYTLVWFSGQTMGRPYSIDNYLKVRFAQSLSGAVSKMYNTNQKMTNTSRDPQLSPLLLPVLEFLRLAAASVVCRQRLLRVPAERGPGPTLLQCSSLWQLLGGPCQPRRLSGENTQLATLRNTTTETQSQAQPSRGQLLQWRFRERRPL